MASVAEVRAKAFEFAAVEESEREGMTVFTVRDRPFAAVTDDGRLQVHLPQNEIDHALRTYPSTQVITHGDEPIGVHLELAEIDESALASLMHAGWVSRAPKLLIDFSYE